MPSFEPLKRAQHQSDMRRFRSFNNSTRKTVLNLLEAGNLRLRELVVKRLQ